MKERWVSSVTCQNVDKLRQLRPLIGQMQNRQTMTGI